MHTVRDTVIGVLAEAVDRPAENIAVTDTLDSLGVDSLELLEIGLNLEDHYGDAAYLGSNDLSVLTTVQDLINFITNRL